MNSGIYTNGWGLWQCDYLRQNLIRRNKKTFIKMNVGKEITVTREWAMPSIWTFKVKPFKEIILKYLTEGWADPFAGENSPAEITNDIEGRGNKHQMDALEFLKSLPDNSVNGVLFDPPYSTEQCLRRYTPKQKGTAGRAEYWAKCKDEIARIVRPEGTVISFCWDSTGIGKKRGFEIVEIKLVCHGACHNDTIVTIEKKREGNFNKSFSEPSLFETENEALPQARVIRSVCEYHYNTLLDEDGSCPRCKDFADVKHEQTDV